MTSNSSRNNQDITKEALQQQMDGARERLAETVGEIKETVEEQYLAAKETITGVMDYREQFSKEPLVWSLGALSAGFALGYTMGYAHKRAKGKGKHSEVAAFADSLVQELSRVGSGVVIPSINLKTKELFGFDFSELLDEIGSSKPKTRKPSKKIGTKKRPARKHKKKAGPK